MLKVVVSWYCKESRSLTTENRWPSIFENVTPLGATNNTGWLTVAEKPPCFRTRKEVKLTVGKDATAIPTPARRKDASLKYDK